MKLLLILNAMMFGLGLVTPSLGQELPSEYDKQPSGEVGEVADDPGKFGLHFQVGGFMSLWTNIEGSGKANYLITGDLVGLNWSRTNSTFGAGIHFTFDENGHRFGFKGLWRTPLVRGGGAYFQLSPGVYLFAADDYKPPSIPGYFLEAELGLTSYFALVTGLEVLPYKDREVGFDINTYESIYEESGTATSMYLGAKVGQWPGFIMTVSALVVGAIAVGSSMSGGVM
jgi:hypothetical protein